MERRSAPLREASTSRRSHPCLGLGCGSMALHRYRQAEPVGHAPPNRTRLENSLAGRPERCAVGSPPELPARSHRRRLLWPPWHRRVRPGLPVGRRPGGRSAMRGPRGRCRCRTRLGRSRSRAGPPVTDARCCAAASSVPRSNGVRAGTDSLAAKSGALPPPRRGRGSVAGGPPRRHLQPRPRSRRPNPPLVAPRPLPVA